LEWRLVRSSLRRQPASPVSRDFRLNVARKPAVGGLVASGGESLRAHFENSSAHHAENLRATSALFPFSGETSQRPGSSTLGGWSSSVSSAPLPLGDTELESLSVGASVQTGLSSAAQYQPDLFLLFQLK
jgi:hypothetical protein